MFKSILESGQEEVPERVWEGVASELTRREKVARWWRRTATGVAVAAAVVVGVLLHQPSEEVLVPAGEGIAVAETFVDTTREDISPEETSIEETAVTFKTKQYMAYAPTIAKPTDVTAKNCQQSITTTKEEEATTEAEPNETAITAEKPAFVPFPEEWKQEETAKKHRVKASVTLFGNTGANTLAKTGYEIK